MKEKRYKPIKIKVVYVPQDELTPQQKQADEKLGEYFYELAVEYLEKNFPKKN